MAFTRFDGEVRYSQTHNRFFQIRGVHDDYYRCGGFSEFYTDAETTLREQNLSYQLIGASLPVGAIDQFEYAELNTQINAWQIIQSS